MSSTPYFFVFIIISHFLNFTSYYLLLFFYFILFFFCLWFRRLRLISLAGSLQSAESLPLSHVASAWCEQLSYANELICILTRLDCVSIAFELRGFDSCYSGPCNYQSRLEIPPPLLCGNSVSVCKLATFICIFPSQYFNFNQCSLQRNSSTSNRIRLI